MDSHISALKSLHTTLVDSLNGYREALKDAEGKGLTPLFADMIDLRTRHIGEVAAALRDQDQPVDDDGSLLTVVHKVVMTVSAVFTGLDERILPGLIDGEQRICTYYDAALANAPVDGPERAMLVRQHAAVQSKIDQMKTMTAAAA